MTHVLGTTGYSSNRSVWAKALLQQPSGPLKQKRKKWHHPFGGDSEIYQIKEEEENRVVKFPPISVDVKQAQPDEKETIGVNGKGLKHPAGDKIGSHDDARKSFIDRNEKNERENITEHQNIPEMLHVGKDIPKHVSNNEGNIGFVLPEIVVSYTEDMNTTDHESSETSGIRTETAVDSAKLSPPSVFKSEHSQFLESPPPIFNNLPDKKRQQKDTDWNIHFPRISQNPKYTHIRVPRRRTTHVSQESLDSPLSISYSNHKGYSPFNSNIKHSGTSPSNITKVSLRKKWNVKSMDEPIRLYTSPPTTSSLISEGSVSSEQFLHCGNEKFNSVVSGKLSAYHRNLSWYAKGGISQPSNAKNSKLGAKSKCGVLDTQGNPKKRKKWVLPDFWPKEDDIGLYELTLYSINTHFDASTTNSF